MKVCLTRESPEVREWSLADLAATLTAPGTDEPLRADVMIGEKLLTVFRGDPGGLSLDLRYEGHRLNARIAFVDTSELLNALDVEAWLRAKDAHDEPWNLHTDLDFQRARSLLA
jgi:hypothetical protein